MNYLKTMATTLISNSVATAVSAAVTHQVAKHDAPEDVVAVTAMGTFFTTNTVVTYGLLELQNRRLKKETEKKMAAVQSAVSNIVGEATADGSIKADADTEE
jgi:phosphoribosylpyrophosphate synthetase